MKRISNIVYLMAALCCLASCEKQIEFNLDETDPKIVVNSLVDADSTLTARVTLSRFFLDNTSFKVVDDATMSLEVNGVSAGTAQYADGYYTLNATPQPGDTLTLEVSVPQHGTVKAGTRVPYRPDITQVKVLSHRIVDYCDQEFKFSFELKDRPGEHVGYMVSADVVDTFFVKDTTYPGNWDEYGNFLGYDTIPPHEEVESYTLWLTSDDPILSNGTDLGSVLDILKGGSKAESQKSFLFLDDDFQGKSHEFVITGSCYDYNSDRYDIENLRRGMKVTIKVMSYDLYLYVKTRKQASDSDGIFSEPVQVYCNIDGGMGIFGSMSKSEKMVKVE